MNEKVLEVKDLRVSFRTNNGTVKAVRGINLSLYRGRTLAIVGESGSGKSVTSRAILGILAGNKLIDGGQIVYDGRDLLTLSEEELTKIRGSRISMIFQDPMSSLNPIMKVGRQLTEAMILKNKSARKYATKEYKKQLTYIGDYALSQKIADRGTKNAIFYDYVKVISQNKKFEGESAKLFNEMVEKAITYYYLRSGEGKKDVVAKFNEIVKNNLLNKEQLEVKAIKKLLPQINKLFKKAIYPLALNKDDLGYIFVSTLKAYLKDYHSAIIETRKLDKNSKNKSSIKTRAFSHEVVATPKEIIDKITALFTKIIDAYQEELKISKETTTEEAQKLIASIAKNIQESQVKVSKSDAKNRAMQLLGEVGIPEPQKRFYQYPFQFSGGMRQRIVIAIALASNPEILICDEPTTALDVTIQAQILELINKLKVEKGLSVIFITHDLGVVANMADDIAVMYAGKIVEIGTVYEVFYDPLHPYTWALLSSMPDLNTKEKLEAIPGTPPNMILPPVGDAFAARNKYAMEIDFEKEPPLFPVTETHFAATWLLHPNAPKVEKPKIVIERIAAAKARGELNGK